jgi:hypothetical protein
MSLDSPFRKKPKGFSRISAFPDPENLNFQDSLSNADSRIMQENPVESST